MDFREVTYSVQLKSVSSMVTHVHIILKEENTNNKWCNMCYFVKEI